MKKDNATKFYWDNRGLWLGYSICPLVDIMLYNSRYIGKQQNYSRNTTIKGQIDITVSRAFDLQAANPDMIPGISYGPISLPGITSESRPGVTQECHVVAP